MTSNYEAISINSTWSEVYALADSYRQQQQWDKAAHVYRHAIKLNPNFFWSYHNLGNALIQLQQWTEAVSVYRSAIQLDPSFFWSHHNLGDALINLQQWTEAVSVYRRAIQLDPSFFWSYHNLGDALIQLQQWDEAIAVYLKAIQLQTNLSIAHLKLGKALAKKADSQFTKTISFYRQAIRHPEQYPIYTQVLSFLAKNPEFFGQLAGSLVKKHQIIGAIIVYYMALEIEPDRVEILARITQLLQHKNQLEQDIALRRQKIQHHSHTRFHFQSENSSLRSPQPLQAIAGQVFFSTNRQIDSAELEELCSTVGWKRRPLKKVTKAIAHSFLVVSIWNKQESDLKLIGFARVITDCSFHATILDVIIHPDFQNHGLGKTLIKFIVNKLHSEDIWDITLFASVDLVDFYHRLGFIAEPNEIKWMLWCSD